MIPAASCSASSLRDFKVITASALSGWSRNSWQKKPQLLRHHVCLSKLFQEEIAMLELISDAESCSAVSLWLSVRGDSAPSTLTTKPTNHEPAPPSSIVHFYVHLHSVAPPTHLPPTPTTVFLRADILVSRATGWIFGAAVCQSVTRSV